MGRRTPLKLRVQYVLEGAVAYFVVGAIMVLPLRVASAVGGWLGRTIGPRVGASRRAVDNIRRAMPGTPKQEVARIVRGMWDNLGRTGFEYPHLRSFRERDLMTRAGVIGFGRIMRAADAGRSLTVSGRRLEVDGMEHLLDFYFKPGSRIIFSGHFGNWEMMPTCAGSFGLPLDVMFRRPNNPHVDRLLAWMRREHGGLVPKGLKSAMASNRVLKDGGLLGMLVDQKHNQGMAIPFFGEPVMTAPMVARLALQYRCPLHGAWCQRLGGARFRVTITPPLDIPDSGDMREDTRRLLTEVNATVEGWVRERPDQWMWVHRRWPKTPLSRTELAKKA